VREDNGIYKGVVTRRDYPKGMFDVTINDEVLPKEGFP
jgi:hypothetical protein